MDGNLVPVTPSEVTVYAQAFTALGQVVAALSQGIKYLQGRKKVCGDVVPVSDVKVCPSCGAQLKVAPDLRLRDGLRCRCSVCQAKLRIRRV